MRARMALHYAGIAVEHREIALRAKPAHMLQISPKGTVPVLLLNDGTVLEESLDIMRWALVQRDKGGWLAHYDAALIADNDGAFKQALDRYKYAENSSQKVKYRAEAEQFLQKLEARLQQHAYLCDTNLSATDIAIFPFIRQFAGVDDAWFQQSPYPVVRQWLNGLVGSELFTGAMQKYPTWVEP
jgi:glutathione S-transferase